MLLFFNQLDLILTLQSLPPRRPVNLARSRSCNDRAKFSSVIVKSITQSKQLEISDRVKSIHSKEIVQNIVSPIRPKKHLRTKKREFAAFSTITIQISDQVS